MKRIYQYLGALFFTFIFTISVHAENPKKGITNLKNGDFVPSTVMIKVKSSARLFCGPTSIDEPALKQVLSGIGVTSVVKNFPHAVIPATERNEAGKKYTDLSLIYLIHYSGSLPVDEAIRRIKSSGIIDYAEPRYVQHLCYTPNDPQVGSQYHIAKINAYNAWNVWKGDTNTVIGIVDSGTDWDHPDLVNNIKYNYADPIDGIDNDGDGFVDNFRGWDISENDNDPMVVSSDHGSHVSGCAAASTDNSTGVASPAFKCKFLPVKCSLDASTSSIDNGYEGITYAADHGCSVINCSWGRAGAFSQFEQDVINYAAVNHDVVMVVAAGNDAVEEDFWPAAYDHVVSVGATNSNDSKASFSNYGFHVDVCAPGNNILSTIYNNTYTTLSGTSMASPIAAGCVAMIRSKFPSMNADQAAEQLRITCDNIYGVITNGPYVNKLGSGRVNLFRAVTDSVSPGILVSNLQTTDGNDNAFVINDTLRIGALFTNLLRPSVNLTVTLSSASSYVTVLGNTFTIGALNTNDSISNYNLPFLVKINPSAPANSTVALKMTMTDGAYSDFYSFNVIVNVDYLNIDVNDVSTSITSTGKIGYNTFGPGQGLGFTYLGSNSLLYEAGLMTGTDITHVSSIIRSGAGVTDNDYQSVQVVQQVLPGISSFDAYGKFNDAISTTTAPLHLLITHHAYAFAAALQRNYIMVTYTIQNTGAAALNNFYAGIFADWDVLPNYANNRCSMDLGRRMGYAFSADSGGYYTGVKLLSPGGFNQYAIDNDLTGSGGVNLNDADGYSIADKYTTLSTSRSDAGVAGTGNDVCDVVSTGPFTINANDSIVVAFALIAGNDLTSIQNGADASQITYQTMTGITEIALGGAFDINQVYPNPVRNQANITFTLSESNYTDLSVYNTMGQKIKNIVSEKLNAGKFTAVIDLSSLESGNYLCRLTSDKFSKSYPVIIAH